LEKIKSFFGNAGSITSQSKNSIQYRVTSSADLQKFIIPHFLKHPLLTQKKADFILFKQVLDIINNKDHLSIEGLQKIVNLKASLNKGLSEELKRAFPNTIPTERPEIFDQKIFDPY
jgi:protein-arginine kinase